MQVDTRAYRPGYSPQLLAKKWLENAALKRQIARAYLAGANPKELAEQHNLSVQKVMSIALWYDRERVRARRLALAAGATPKVAMPEPTAAEVAEPESPHYVVRVDGMAISLPMLSILRGQDR